MSASFDLWAGDRLALNRAGQITDADFHDALLNRLADLVYRRETDNGPGPALDLKRTVQRFVAIEPSLSIGWTCLLMLGGRRLSAAGALTGLVNRAAVARGLFQRTLRPGDAFKGAVLAKQILHRRHDREIVTVSHCLGLQSLVRATGKSVSTTAAGATYHLTVGDNRAVLQANTPELRFLLMNLFLFEPGMWRWLSTFGPEDRFLDIGANIGTFSIAAACLFGIPTVAIEPFPTNVDTLKANVAANRAGDRITVLPIAATDRERRDRLFFGQEIPGVADQHFGADRGITAPDSVRNSIEIDGIPVDRLIARGVIAPPTRIKIDVDGGEADVIAGMETILADPDLLDVRMEIRWWHDDAAPVMARMKAHGFDHRIDDERKNLLFTRRAGVGLRSG